MAEQLNATVIDMRWVKPLDEELVLRLAEINSLLVTVEENAVAGGAGSAVAEFLSGRGVYCDILHLGLPDQFIEHASAQEQHAQTRLDEDGILNAVRRRTTAKALHHAASIPVELELKA